MMELSGLLHGILFTFFVMVGINLASATTQYNVLNFGAKPNGRTDSTNAFLSAWNAACVSADSNLIYVPKGRYLLGSMEFKGQCKSPQITIRIDGSLVAPVDYNVLGKSANWLSFEGVSGVSIIGGALDAKGPSLWACKASNTNCPAGATTLSFTNSNNIKINGLMSLNSQMFHIVINGCQNAHVQGVKIMASGNSPNTDGIHVQLSSNVEIINCSIKTGDDCISIGPGTKNLWIERNPIVIDQNYCPNNLNCPGQVSGIKIKDIIYEDIRGTSSTPVAIKFDCSAKNPCTEIKLRNVNLTNLNKAAQSSCSNAIGKAFDLVRPNSCL
ncbi:hypothetical protein PTKIN_Ptkin16aG0052600 [Pterospermum kingtungense]